MKRFMLPRIAHCNQGHAPVLGTTVNCLPLRGGTQGSAERPGHSSSDFPVQVRRATTMAKDPVCGMQVDEKNAAATTVYKGTTYYFCAPACKTAFEKAPEKFLGKTGTHAGH